MSEPGHYEIKHVTRYRYAVPARECLMLLCLKPGERCGQRLLRFDMTVRPRASLNPETDCFGNTRHVLNIHRPHTELEIIARSAVAAPATPLLPGRLGADAWEEIRAAGQSVAEWDFTRPSRLARPSPALDAFVERVGVRATDDPLESLLRLSEVLHRNLRYAPGSTSVESSTEHILATGEGVCQDYAHLMIAIARAWGIPTRYVFGYLHLTDCTGGQIPDNTTHAWVECRLPQIGWVGIDPTNDCIAGNDYIRVAVGRDFHDVSPTRGIRQGGGETRLHVDVRVCKIDQYHGAAA